MDKIVSEWVNFFQNNDQSNWWARKNKLWQKRGAIIVRIKGTGYIFHKLVYEQMAEFQYLLHLSFFIQHKAYFYEEETVIPYRLLTENGVFVKHEELKRTVGEYKTTPKVSHIQLKDIQNERFSYDRLAAVKYAEHWWNSYNPQYRKFDVDCTNFVSQCLRAGGAPMYGYPQRDKGWWYAANDWSFSWAVAHSLRWYLSGSTEGLRGREVHTAAALQPGDVICYDFQGDGRWDHTTIVVAKDAEGMPLVNAHTDNSRHRYWSYEDSTAWTPDIQYKFFQIGM